MRELSIKCLSQVVQRAVDITINKINADNVLSEPHDRENFYLSILSSLSSPLIDGIPITSCIHKRKQKGKKNPCTMAKPGAHVIFTNYCVYISRSALRHFLMNDNWQSQLLLISGKKLLGHFMKNKCKNRVPGFFKNSLVIALLALVYQQCLRSRDERQAPIRPRKETKTH